MAHGAPSSSITYKWPYHMFLSFRGEDANSSFTSHLHQSLIQTGIRVFHNEELIWKSENITATLFNGIHKSRVTIIVFSKNYANSRVYLQELVQILEFLKEEGRLIYAGFYDLDTLKVRHQTRSYAEALVRLEERVIDKRDKLEATLARLEEKFIDKRDPVEEWRRALSQAVDLSGYHFGPKTTNIREGVRAIVERVIAWMNKKEKDKEEEHGDNEKEEANEEEHDDIVMPLGTLSSSITYKGHYHVFLSYCVEDRFYFTDLHHLCLLEEQFLVFVSKGIRLDEDITYTLFKAIHESRIATIVFSKNYAKSKICLQELVQMLESFKEEGWLIFPVYYNVDPSEAWAQLDEGFKDKRDQVERWRPALSQDYHSLTKTTDIREGVRAIIERVTAWMNKKEEEEEEHDDNEKEEEEEHDGKKNKEGEEEENDDRKSKEGEEEEHDDKKNKEGEEEKHDDKKNKEGEEEEHDVPKKKKEEGEEHFDTTHVFLSCHDLKQFDFPSLLSNYLHREGLSVYHIPKTSWILRGEHITYKPSKSLYESRIAIIVFSKNYVDSAFRSKELIQILECFRAEGWLIYPVFYDVDLSEVLAQLGKKFKGKKEQVEEWRLALAQVAGLSHYHYFLPKIISVHDFVRAIVERITPWMNEKEKYWVWEKGKEIGAGAHGIVYKAQRRKTRAICGAVKEPNIDRANAYDYKRNEINLLSQLEEHPNIVKYYGHKEDVRGRISLCMEYIHPGSLKNILERGKLDGPLIQNYTAQVLFALAPLHSKTRVHRIADICEGVRAIVERLTAWLNENEKEEEEEHDDNKKEEEEEEEHDDKKNNEGEEEEHDDKKNKEGEEEHDDKKDKEGEEEHDDKKNKEGEEEEHVNNKRKKEEGEEEEHVNKRRKKEEEEEEGQDDTIHVFLNYHDVKQFDFPSLLNDSLCQEGLRVYHVAEINSIMWNEHITYKCSKARIGIIVFSREYRDSPFCLNQLKQILECFKGEGRLIHPVFYDMDPSEVLAQLEEKFKCMREEVEEWRLALAQAPILSNYHHFQPKKISVHEFIRLIVERVTAWMNEQDEYWVWKKGKEIGRGAHGIVYEARDRKTRAICGAVKELDIDRARALECIRCEIKILSQLKEHPNIVKYYGHKEEGGRISLYMEYIQPGSLTKYISKSKKRKLDRSLIQHFTAQILFGLVHLHSNKGVHRDLKPDNLLVDSKDIVKLADFGLAKLVAESMGKHSVSGTQLYAAPELLRNNDYQSSPEALAADIFSLGCVIIEMSSGNKPCWPYYARHPTIPEELCQEGKKFLKSCFRLEPAKRPSAKKLLKHPFVKAQAVALKKDTHCIRTDGSETC